MDCKHLVGYSDEGYDGVNNVEFGDEVYWYRDIVFYKFCPLCGEELKGELVVVKEYVPKEKQESLLSCEEITKEALRVLHNATDKTGN